MRSLTEAETRVIRILLANLPGPERNRIRDAEVPRTTYQTVRHRAFLNGWLQERYFPHPLLFGAERIRFVLAQPYAERWNESVRMLRSLEGLVILWASPETLFGVVYEESTGRRWNDLFTSDVFRRSWTIAAPARGDGIVSYFDYEGVWSRWALNRDPLAYPRGLPAANLSALPQSKADWNSVRELLVRPSGATSIALDRSVFRATGLSRRGRKLLSAGWFSHRILPNLGEIPTIRGYRPDRVVFVTATPLPGKSTRDFFADLTRLGRASPFVFAYDSDRVLFATLSPAPLEVAEGRTPMVDLLQNYLAKVEVIREPIDSLFPLVDHRYDRLKLPARESGTRSDGRPT